MIGRARFGVVVAAAAVVGFIAVPGVPSSGQEPPPITLSDYGLTDSGGLNTPTLATGTVTASDGTPFEGRLVAFAWPHESVLAAMEVGDSFQPLPIAADLVSTSGEFQLRVAPEVDQAVFDAAVTDSTGNATHAELSIYGISPDGEVAMSAASVQLNPDYAPSDSRAWPKPDSDPVPVELSIRAEGSAFKIGEDVVYPDPGDVESDGETGDFQALPCDTVMDMKYGPDVKVLLFEQNNEGPTRSDFRFYTGASSELGVAVRNTGSGYRGGNVTTRSYSAGLDYPTAQAGQSYRLYTKWQYARYQMCTLVPGPPGFPPSRIVTGYEARPYRFTGGVYRNSREGYVFEERYCRPLPKGSRFTRSSARASTYSFGVQAEVIIGIDMSSQTGMTQRAENEVYAESNARICGAGGYAVSAGRWASRK